MSGIRSEAFEDAGTCIKLRMCDAIHRAQLAKGGACVYHHLVIFLNREMVHD